MTIRAEQATLSIGSARLIAGKRSNAFLATDLTGASFRHAGLGAGARDEAPFSSLPGLTRQPM
jgi:hypothetical protein